MRVLFVSLFIIILDQVSKFLVKGISIPSLNINIQGMHYQQSINLIGDFFKLTYIENPGMAFGIQIGGKLFLSLFTIAATLLIVYFIYKNRNEPLYLRVALALILGGAVGNLIDRIFYGVIYGYAPLFYGNVVDFFHIDTPNFMILGKQFYSWPIFNIADVAVSLGFVMILFGYRKIAKPKETPEQEQIKPEETENTFTTEINSPLEPPPMERDDNTQLSS
ncbi:MAG TPA: signal peptidase II [Ignavibacteria bacterium]|nr:signal peptidase II [Ignavibacteria bacterium]